tara:strand:+ start:838 stop:2043 length:1206 start_codon:yes stop_codon:yes gene_type:complete
LTNKKITDLPVATGASLADDDKFVVVDVSADETKSITKVELATGIVDTAGVNAAGAVMNTDTSTVAMDFVINEGSFVTNSATLVPTQQSVKTYVDLAVASQVTYQGSYDAATNTPNLDSAPSGVSVGDMYTVTVAGTFFATALEIGDVLIAEVDDPTVESNWTVVNKDLDAASIKASYESNADTNAFTDAEHSKLSGIETAADVTDTTNVTAAGALMDSEVTNLAQVKAFDYTDYATAAQGSTADNALQPNGDGSLLTGIYRAAQIRNTSTITNVNSTTSFADVVITGTNDFTDTGFTAGSTGIVCGFTGRILVTVHIRGNSSVQRAAPIVRAAVAGTGSPIVGATGYIRGDSGHSDSTSTATCLLSVTSGQEVTLQTMQGGASGTVTGVAGGCMILIQRT